MLHFFRQSPAPAPTPRPGGTRPRFRPAVERLDDRITPALVLATQLPFAVVGTYDVAVGDLNGDGRADIASANLAQGNGTTVSVLVNATPAGTSIPMFAAKQDFAVGSGPIAVAIADFNGDGRPDLAVANRDANTVSVLLNTTPAGAAALTFAPQVLFAVGTQPTDIRAGDFNSDGRSDLAVANRGANTVSVLMNTTAMQAGTATFGPQATFAVGTNPGGIAVGDFNADGRTDFATANFGTNNVSVRLNTTGTGATTGTFAAQQTFAVGTQPREVAAGDFNGDGRLDLVVSNVGVGQNSVSVLRNTTPTGGLASSFAAQATFTVGASPSGVEVADFDGDGRTDIATANTNNVSVLTNTTPALAATATFAAKQDFAVESGASGLAAGDFTGDGRTDIVAANSAGFQNTVSVLRNTSTNVLPTTTSPALVAQVGTTGGVAAYNRATGTWIQLTGANANALAASASGNVVASFGGNGVWYYRAAGQTWTQINGNQAVAVAIDPLGNAYASFAGFGTATYRLAGGGWVTTTGSVANILAASANGDLIGNFAGFGVYRYRYTTNWQQINGFDATSLAVDRNGYVAAAFGGFGVGQYIPYANGWRIIAPAVAATAVAMDGYGNPYASLPGFGVGKFDHTNTWKNLAPGASASTLAADWYGNVFASFAGWPGVWEYNPHYGWQWKQPSAVTLLSLGA